MKFLIVCILTVVNLFAVITISPINISDKMGYSAILKGSFETKRGNSDVDNYSAGVRVRYDEANKYTLSSDFIFSYGKASGEVNTNKTYAHIRLIHTFLDIKEINSEYFIQSETNEFTNIKNKLLLGGGLRYHKDLEAYGNLYFGLGAFGEKIEYLTSLNENEYNLRLNSYISYTKKFSSTSKLSYVMYYQPDLTKFSDFIFSNGLEVEVLIYKELYVSFVLYYDIDSKPAVGVEDTDISQKTSFIYKF